MIICLSDTYCRRITSLFSVAVLFSLFGCSSDNESNDDIEQLAAEMCLVTTDDAKQIVSATTDSDVKLVFSKPLTASWVQKKDTLYRALIYYNKVSDYSVMPLRADKVYILDFNTHDEAKEWKNDADPLELLSSWFAKNGNYLNLHLALKNGSTEDDDQTQTMGLVCDSTVVSENGRHRYCHLCHNQNNVPTYYTVDVYASIPTDGMRSGDTLSITFPLWSGNVQKCYIKY